MQRGGHHVRPVAASAALASVQACVIFNPTARGERARGFRQFLDSLTGQCALRPTSGPGSAVQLAAEAVKAGFDTLVAAGGDGTVNEVLNGMAAAPGGLEHARLAVLPLGTVNVFAKELDLPHDLAGAWETVQRGNETRIDLPLVDFTEGGKPRRAYFAQLGGAGFDSCALEKVEWKWKKRSGMLAYGLAVLRAKLATPRLVTAAAQEHRASGELVLVGNGRYYAGRAPVFPHGDPRDGLLEVRVFPQVGWFTLFAFAWARVSQRPFRVRGESSFQAGSLMLTSTERVPFELEGDNVGCLPATFSVLRQALRVIVK